MSDTLMIWKPHGHLNRDHAAQFFQDLAEERMILKHDPALDQFLSAMLDMYPPLENLALDAFSPWAVTPCVADGHIALGIGSNMITLTCDCVDVAHRLGLVVYDPQIDQLYDENWRRAIELPGSAK